MNNLSIPGFMNREPEKRNLLTVKPDGLDVPVFEPVSVNSEPVRVKRVKVETTKPKQGNEIMDLIGTIAGSLCLLIVFLIIVWLDLGQPLPY